MELKQAVVSVMDPVRDTNRRGKTLYTYQWRRESILTLWHLRLVIGRGFCSCTSWSVSCSKSKFHSCRGEWWWRHSKSWTHHERKGFYHVWFETRYVKDVYFDDGGDDLTCVCVCVTVNESLDIRMTWAEDTFHYRMYWTISGICLVVNQMYY